jgi:hypothetical protein
MTRLLRTLLSFFKSETTKVPPGETELDYVPINEITIKKQRNKPKENVKFHPKVKVKRDLKVKN